MPAVTDLTWSQVNVALQQMLGQQADIIETDAAGNPVRIRIDLVLQTGSNSYQDGVIKFMNRLLDACRTAQEAANQGKATGEKLAAFPASVTGTPSAGAVPITRTILSRALISSATQIVGTNV